MEVGLVLSSDRSVQRRAQGVTMNGESDLEA